MLLISTIITETLDPLQFPYHPNRSTDDAISIALIDYSSVFSTIVPSKIITKLRTLVLNTSLCN